MIKNEDFGITRNFRNARQVLCLLSREQDIWVSATGASLTAHRDDDICRQEADFLLISVFDGTQDASDVPAYEMCRLLTQSV